MITLFLATVMGWYFVIIGLYTLLNQELVKAIMVNIIAQKGLYFVVAIITLILGLVMVTSHNIWILGWPVIITMICWITLIGGLIRLFFSEFTMKIWRSYMDNPLKMQVVSVIVVIIGLYLLFHVYYPRLL